MTDFYSKNASKFIREYEAIAPENIHGRLLDYIPDKGALILDVGAGSGRDAAWLVDMGHEVVAVEPSDRLRNKARRIHPSPSIQWIKDALPKLKRVHESGYEFDLILLSAVWNHVLPNDREQALQSLSSLLKPSGHLAISLRHGPSPDEREFFDETPENLTAVAYDFGLTLINRFDSGDKMGRSDTTWVSMIFQMNGNHAR